MGNDINYAAPIGSVDLEAFDDDGDAYVITACNECLPWRAEVVVEDDGHILVREWHAVACPEFVELIDLGRPGPAGG